MGKGSWLRPGKRRKDRSTRAGGNVRNGNGAGRGSKLDFEALEDRHMLATFLVTNIQDAGLGSLRWAVDQANAAGGTDNIVFADNIFQNAGLTNQAVEQAIEGDEQTFQNGGIPIHAIVLETGEMEITEAVRILGPGARRLIIHQDTDDNDSRIFDIKIGADDRFFEVEISGVTLQGGQIGGTGDERKGGAVWNREILTMKEVRVRGNFASTGGGGVFTEFGRSQIYRSEFYSNFSGAGEDLEGGGGGILNGAEGSDADNLPSTLILDTTIHGNSSVQGGGVMNRNGRLEVYNSTITENSGGGIGSWGNPREENQPATVRTVVGNNIIWNNFGYDLRRLGFTDGENPLPLLASIETRGYNIYSFDASINDPIAVGPDGEHVQIEDPESEEDPKPLIDLVNDQYFNPAPEDPEEEPAPPDLIDVDPLLQELGDYGGNTDTYLLDPTSPAIDMGNASFFFTFSFSEYNGIYDNRGRQFRREFDYTGSGMPTRDIGAVEMQAGIFVVDTLIDEFDYSYEELYFLEFISGQPTFTIFPDYGDEFGDFGDSYVPPEVGKPYPGRRLGDLSLREALAFAQKNPGPDTIQFSQILNTLDALERQDPDPSPAPTIVLNRARTLAASPFGGGGPFLPLEGPLKLARVSALYDPSLPVQLFANDGDLNLEGPQGFILEIDASGNDGNVLLQTGGGTRVLDIDDFDPMRNLNITISNLTVMGGDAPTDGGGIISRETLMLDHVTVKNNNSLDDGGGLFTALGTVTIVGSTFNNNRAADNGGGLNVSSGAVVNIANSTFSGNNSNNRGGAIYNEGSTVLVEYSTITLNKAGSTRGSGILNISQGAALPTTSVRSSIISDNDSDTDVDFLPSASVSTFVSLGWNFIGKGNAKGAFSAATNDQVDKTNPMLDPLINSGGLVATHRPQLGSPVIDAGDPAAAGAPTNDQRGGDFLRVVDGNADGVARIDIGAYELQKIVLTVSNPSDENDGVVTVGELSLREAIALANANPFFDEITFDSTMIADLTSAQQNDPKIFLGDSALVPGTPSDIRITGSVRIYLQPGDVLAIDGESLDDPASTITGSRMFTVNDGNANTLIDVTIEGFEFRNARSPFAGSVFWSSENLTLDHVTLVNNQTIADAANTLTGLHGGAIYQQGAQGAVIRPKLTIQNDSSIISNQTFDADADGGAIYVTDADLEMAFTAVAGNSTNAVNSAGGGIYLRRATFTADAFTSISGNATIGGQADGGGFFAEDSTVIFNGSIVSGNRTQGANSEGGGFAGLNSTITLNDVNVTENDTLGSQSVGGGIYVQGGTLNLNRSAVSNNSTIGVASHGGGLAMNGGVVALDASTVAFNTIATANGIGGGVWNNNGALTVRGTTVANNQALGAQSRGGGVYSDTNLTGARTLILNSTIARNSSTLQGGGIFNADGRLDIQHSTITENATPAMNTGSGLASFGTAATTLTTIYSSIIAQNVGVSDGNRTDVDSVAGLFQNTIKSVDQNYVDANANGADDDGNDSDAGFNVIGTGNSAASYRATDQTNILDAGFLSTLFGEPILANYGGSVETYVLELGSAAINAGPTSFNANSYSPALIGDQRGAARVQGGRIDVGATELGLVPALPADTDNDNDVDGSDFLTWQRNLGAVGASKAQGDADGNGAVNGQDLAVWRSSFGSVNGASVVSSAASSSSAVVAAAESSPEINGGEGARTSTSSNFASLTSLTSLATLGTPAATATFARSSDSSQDAAVWISQLPNSATPQAWDHDADAFSAFGEAADFDEGLLEAGVGVAAEDIAFADWDGGLLL